MEVGRNWLTAGDADLTVDERSDMSGVGCVNGCRGLSGGSGQCSGGSALFVLRDGQRKHVFSD